MRFVFLAIVLAFPILDLYVTVRFARWTGVPVWAWLGMSVIGGFLLLRNERIAFRANTVARMHGEQPLLRGLLDSGRKVLAGMLLLLPGVISDLIALRAARAADQRRPRLRAARRRATAAAARRDRRRVPAPRLTAVRRPRGPRPARPRHFIRSSTVGSSLPARRYAQTHHHDAVDDHRQRQPLPHRQAERQQPEEAVRLAREFGDEAARAVADRNSPDTAPSGRRRRV